MALSVSMAFTSAGAQSIDVPDARPVPHHARIPAPRGGLDGRVAALTRVLDLTDDQQNQVRGILKDQRIKVGQIWEDQSVPAAYRIHATRLLGEETSGRIRALLSEEQKKKFTQPAPERQAPADAMGGRSLDEWIRVATPN